MSIFKRFVNWLRGSESPLSIPVYVESEDDAPTTQPSASQADTEEEDTEITTYRGTEAEAELVLLLNLWAIDKASGSSRAILVGKALQKSDVARDMLSWFYPKEYSEWSQKRAAKKQAGLKGSVQVINDKIVIDN